MTEKWIFWFPDSGETEEDAHEYPGYCPENIYEYVAEYAGWFDYHNCDGWEREMEDPYPINIKGPSGNYYHFIGHNYLEIRHSVKEIKDDERQGQ